MLSLVGRCVARLVFGAYRYFFSPAIHLLAGSGSGCRFEPTCGDYASQAVQKHGWFAGSFLAFKRVLRCHPFSGSSGLDPVPEHCFCHRFVLDNRRSKG